MKTFKNDKGETVITTGGAEPARKPGRPKPEIISTNNIEEIRRKRTAEPAKIEAGTKAS